VLNKGVELLLGVLILVLLSADSHADLSGHVSNTRAPHKSVQAGINADVLNTFILDRRFSYLGEHLSLCEFPDLSEGSGSSLLELDFVESLVEIDGVISGHGLDLLLLSFLHTRHFLSFSNILIINIETPFLFIFHPHI